MNKSETLTTHKNGDLLYFSFPSIDNSGCAISAFTTRLGGVSTGVCGNMNMGFSRGENHETVLENYKIICKQLNVDYKKCVLSHQTHTTNIKIINEDDIGKGVIKPLDYTDIDGLITNIPNVTLVTQYADCVPLLFCDPIKKVVATSHAGWRGTVNRIAEKTIDAMVKNFGSKPSDILAAIGPSICQECFEVDFPVFEEFLNAFKDDISTISKKGLNEKYYIDLWAANKLVLTNCGVKSENITVTDLCTKCNSDVFHSHRATNGQRGNLAALITLK